MLTTLPTSPSLHICDTNALDFYLNRFLHTISLRLERYSPLSTPLDIDSMPFADSTDLSPLPTRFQSKANPADPAVVTRFDITDITEALRMATGRLVLLGRSGSGKTTVLLEKAICAAQECRQHPSHPVPIWIDLLDWDRREPLLRWALTRQETRDIVALTEGGQRPLLFFLDGLERP